MRSDASAGTAPWHYVNIPTTAAAFDRTPEGNDGDYGSFT
jgi:hypothetical protein